MTMLDVLTPPMRSALDQIRASGVPSASKNTVQALMSRGLIAKSAAKPSEWALSPVGETAYFEHGVMRKQQVSDFQIGQAVQRLVWLPGDYPWRFAWRAGKVLRLTKAFVFVIYPDGTVQRHKPNSLRHQPATEGASGQ